MLFSPRNPARDRRQRLGKSALNSLMRDPRYFDGTHKEHSAMVDLVRRGFELVYDEPDGADDLSPAGPKPLAQKRGRTILTGARLARPFADAIARLAGQSEKTDSLPEADREVLGRRALLSALKSTRAAFPSGFEKELRALSRPEPRSADAAPGPSTPPPPDREPEKPKKPQGPESEKKPESPEKPAPEKEEDKCASWRAELQKDDAELREIRSKIEAARRKIAELTERIKNKEKKTPRANGDYLVPNPEAFDRDDDEGRRHRRGRPIRSPQELFDPIWDKWHQRRDFDNEEAETKKQLQPQIDELKEEIKQLEELERIKLDLIEWELGKIDEHCPKAD